MTSSALFFLQHEAHSGVSHSLAHPVGFMSNNCVYILCRNYLDRGRDHMRQQRLSAYLVQYLGVFGFEPCAFSRCHDGDGDARSTVGVIVLGGGHSTQYTATVALPSSRVEGANQLRHESVAQACSEVIAAWMPWPPGEIRFGHPP